MKKLLLSLALTVSTMLSTVWAFDFGEVVPSGQLIYFDRLQDECVVVCPTWDAHYTYGPYQKPTGDLVIPSSVTHNGFTYSVTGIEEYAFIGCTGLTSVTIPNSVTEVSYSAFEGCTGLTSVTIPNSVTSIGYDAFKGCTGLTTLNFNAINCSAFSYSSNPFDDCPISTINIGDSVQHIPAYFAHYKTSLSAITIPNSVTYIGGDAFNGCTGLTTVTIPNSVTSIGFNAFGLVKYIIYNGTATGSPWGALSVNGYVEDNFVYADSTKTVLKAYIGTSTSVTIPNSVTSIGRSAFEGCTGLTTVTIPNSVTSIGMCAFEGCTGLTTVTIPNSVTSIGRSAFGLVKHIIYNGTDTGSPWGALSVNGYIEGDFVYADSTKTVLKAYIGTSTSVTIPNSVTSIGDDAFRDWSSFTSITIGNNVTSIGENAFYNCRGLTTLNFNAINCSDFIAGYYGYCPFALSPISTINIGDSVQHIPDFFASYNGSLTSVTIGNSVTSIGRYAFNYCTGLTSVTIPNSITSIREEAFGACSSLTTLNFNAINCDFSFSSHSNHPFIDCRISTINIGDSVQYIPASFAYDFNYLVNLTIGNNVSSIGNSAFYSCGGLDSIIIPNSVTSIGNSAFEECRGVTSITIGNNVTSIERYAFWTNKYSGNLTLNFNAINCNDFPSPIMESEPFKISDITSINIGDSVRYIPAYFAYNRSTESNLSEIIIPNNVISIGGYAFYNCSSITSVSIGNSVTSIGNSAFKNCTSLTTLNFNAINSGDSFWYEDQDPFSGCPINRINIGDSVQRIPAYFAYWLRNITIITIGKNVTTIGNGAFSAYYNIYDHRFSVISKAINPPNLEGSIFSGYDYCTKWLYIPCGSLSNYRNSAWGTIFSTIIEDGCDNITITVTSANENMGTVSGGGEYALGSQVTITATPNQGYRFVSWNDGNTDNPRTITVTEEATYIATFEEAVGIENIDVLDNLTIYPNPTKGILNFSMEVEKIEVMDMMGKMIMEFYNVSEINIASLPKGVYCLKLSYNDKTTVHKIIKE
ncbi:MAG: leucine-rich repeat domain-containing protein [Bacteroidales bacterium]|nr:leucine-rich repeat domain-containing protein [Bacteroidales bacterium]